MQQSHTHSLSLCVCVSVAITYCGPQDPKPYTLEGKVRELCCLKEEEKEGEILPSSLENK